MTDENKEKFQYHCCFALLKDFLLLCGKILLAILECIFGSIFPKSKKSLKDEIVLITGAGGGLGKELVRKFVALEAIVVLWDINEQSIRELESEVRNNGGRAYAYVCDVTDWNSVQKVGKKVKEDVGDVTVLVNNAGLFQNLSFLDLDIQKIKKTFEVNIIAQFWTVRHFLPRMLEMDKGHIVAVSSMAGLVGWLYETDYSASKFAIIGMMEALGEELRSMGKDKTIHCTVVCPLTINTGLNHNPTTRFPWLMPVLETEVAVSEIIGAVQRNDRIITVPRRLLYPVTMLRLFPRKVVQLITDFIGYSTLPNNAESRQ